MKLDDPVTLAVRCRACEREASHEVGAVLFDADALEDWTAAVYVPVSLTCPHCGAVDEHDVLPAPHVAELAEKSRDARAATVREGRAALSDGTPLRTPSEGLALLRERAEEKPKDPLGWRKLGNFALRADRHEEALEAFRAGAAIDGEVECAIAIAAHEVSSESPAAFDALARALSRLPRAEPQRRALQAAQLTELLRQLGHGTLRVSDGDDVDVSSVRDWSRLGERLARPTVRSIRLV